MESTEVNDALTQALQTWNQGNQQGAIEMLRPHAAADERRALLLIAWFLSQMGQPSWNEGVGYARRAAELGMPQGATYYYANFLTEANFRPQAPNLARDAIGGGWLLDPIPSSLQAVQNGDPTTALALLDAATVPRPHLEAWQEHLKQAQADLASLRDAASDIATRREEVTTAIETDREIVEQQRVDVQNRAQSLLDLIEQITNAESTSYFEAEAQRYGGEAKWLWWGAVAILFAAAALTVTPLVIYYVDRVRGTDPWLQGNDLFLAHVTPAVAFGAVAGVLLARARGRDRSRQRARDLSVALQTMFVYGEQIEDPGEKQAFIRDMGRTVIEAFLRQDPGAEAERSILSALRGN